MIERFELVQPKVRKGDKTLTLLEALDQGIEDKGPLEILALEAALKNIGIHFDITASRYCIDELTSLQGSYSQRSQRLAETDSIISNSFIPSKWGPKARSILERHTKNQFSYYQNLVRLGVPEEDARYLLTLNVSSLAEISFKSRQILDLLIFTINSGNEELARVGEEILQRLTDGLPRLQENLLEVANKSKITKDDEKILRALDKQRFAIQPEDAIACFRDYRYGPIMLVDITDNPLFNTSLGAAICRERKSYHEIADHLAKNKPRQGILANGTRQKEHFSVHEHAYVIIKGVMPTVIQQQLRRHRLIDLRVQSLADALENGKIATPETMGELNATAELVESVENTLSAHNSLKSAGISSQEIPYAAVNGILRDFSVSFNLANLIRDYLPVRLCNKAQTDHRNFACGVVHLLDSYDPSILRGIGPRCYPSGICREGKEQCPEGPASVTSRFKELDEKRK